jgi:hypothetical protein
LAAAVCGVAFYGTGTARADFLSVPNFSFESPIPSSFNATVGANGDSNSAIAGWDINGTFPISGGVYANTSAQFPSLPDGSQFAYLRTRTTGDVGTLTLTTSMNTLPSIVAGTAYTLTVAVGHRADNVYPAGNVTIKLMASANGGATWTSVASNTISAEAIADGTFQDVSATLSSAQATLLAGQQLSIQITSLNTSSVGNTANEASLDNVRLFATPAVPEPASLGLMALGAGSLLMRRRRRVG